MQLGSKRCHMASAPCFVRSSEARVAGVPILYFSKRFDSLLSSLETLCVNLSFFLLSVFLLLAKYVHRIYDLLLDWFRNIFCNQMKTLP